MKVENYFTPQQIGEMAARRFQEERSKARLEGWFLAKEIQRECGTEYQADPASVRTAKTLVRMAAELPLTLGEYHLFAGTQDDAFARSYALINPAFQVDSFKGYCDPTAVFDDIEPAGDITRERIQELKEYNNKTEFANALRRAYDLAGDLTSEAVFFVEQVSGHLIPDVRLVLKLGIAGIKEQIRAKQKNEPEEEKRACYTAMDIALDASVTLAHRYADLARDKAAAASDKKQREHFEVMEATLRKVPQNGADNLFEAIQSFILIWQTMCLEQTPNPYAFSVGNADRIFEPYRLKEATNREMSAALFKHLLVFFNVADRSWAISQNLLIGGRDYEGNDLTNPSSYALMDAYYEMNLPQPILSVRLHQESPEKLYQEMGRFFFSPGVLTPSLFNDDSLYPILEATSHIEPADIVDYAVAGCQEPLIMGKDNGNTTNSWLNLGKILELSVNGGSSLISGKRFGGSDEENGYGSKLEVLKDLRNLFYQNVETYIDKMVLSANAASEAISMLPVPFLSVMMGGIESGIDTRDAKRQGTKYNGSGCLIHGLSVVADSFAAIDRLLKERPQDADRMIAALQDNFAHDPEMQQYLLSAPKFGNNMAAVDREAAEIAERVSTMVAARKNYLGNPFRPDWSSPSTHLLYGYWVGATPDGRKAREELNYGIDPLFGEAQQGLGFRILSNMKLPFDQFNGGYASHLGIDPNYFKAETYEGKGKEFRDKVIRPLFYNPMNKEIAPFYLYVNITTAQTLQKVLAKPEKYAPSGVYIMRIHGTFVNFLDLSADIQEDIIKRLDPASTSLPE